MTDADAVRIIVVDDERDIADNLAEILGLEGFDAKAAYEGNDAIALVASFRPECILFDISMPGVDGLALARHMRSAHGDDVILLAMTGDVDNARAQDTFEVVDHYFSKPFDVADLLRILEPRRGPAT